MADEIDALLATPIAQTPTIPVPTAQPGRSPVNYQPREYTDEELGIASPALRTTPSGAVRPAESTAERQLRENVNNPMHDDWIAQQVVAGTLGAGLGELAGPVTQKLLGRVAGRALTSAGENAAVTAATGGSKKDAGIAALIGGAAGGIGGAIEGAPERVRARALKNVVQGEGEGAKPRASLRKKLAGAAGEENERLNDVLDQEPELEHTLSTVGARHPKEALEHVNQIIDRNDQITTPAYKAITAAGGVKLTSVTGPMQKLKDAYLEAGKTQAAEAVQREMESLVKNYGGKEAENAVLTGEQLRGIRNEIGQAAFANQMVGGSFKAAVKRDLYGAYRGAIEGAIGDLGELSPVAADVFRARNKSTSMLLPMRDVLKDRLANEQTGAESLVGRFREAAGKGEFGITPIVTARVIPVATRLAAQAGRHIDAGLAGIQRGASAAPAAEFTPAAAAAVAARAGAANGVSDTAPGRLIKGVRWFGRPATAAERTAAGLPAALDHAISTNNPTLGHAALANEVLGQ